MNTPLYDAMRLYIEQDRARFHMPGHKGRGTPPFSEILPWDITEVAGADSLYHAGEAIDAFERIAAQVYGARRTLRAARRSASRRCLHLRAARAGRWSWAETCTAPQSMRRPCLTLRLYG